MEGLEPVVEEEIEHETVEETVEGGQLPACVPDHCKYRNQGHHCDKPNTIGRNEAREGN
jgi:hypothetical protein